MVQHCETKHLSKSDLHTDNHVSTAPTRLLDISSMSEHTLLVNTGSCSIHAKSRIPQYATLSYCWGGEHSSITTTSNLAERQRRIEVSSLPKTFQDAIYVARSLRIPYLWIDALCIIQNNNYDLEIELSRLKSYYTNSYLTIAASKARSVHDGFLDLDASENET